ncbi:MAG: DinB family protein [Vicinamibacterales bacterium]
MSIVDALLPEFDREMGVTRRLLERVPDGQFAWKPHDRSMTLGRLAEHLAQLPEWATITITQNGIEMGPPAADHRPPATRAAVLELFDQNVAKARSTLGGRTDAELMAPWTLTAQGKEVFTMPKAMVLRSFVMNHLVHHRGQLSVYLRLHNVAIPSIYGPSGDEEM